MHRDPLQGGGGLFLVLFRGAAEQAPAGVAAHQYHISHRCRKVPIHLFMLRHIAHLFAGGHRRLPQDGHGTLQRLNQAQDGFHQGGFAGAVGADNADHIPPTDGESNPLQGQVAAITGAEVGYFQHRGLRNSLCHSQATSGLDWIRAGRDYPLLPGRASTAVPPT